MNAKVIQDCIYQNTFYKEGDIVTGSDNKLQETLDFGYAEVYDGPIEAPKEEETVEETPIEEPESDGKKTAKK